ncbi:MAG: DUF177 domain-containing protein [Fimbriimonadaceae bacterium]|nr:DUF177 domain-containing protein [Fimbriimonadaceae bacterium]
MKREHLLDLNEVLQHPGKKLSIEISTNLENDPEIELMEPMQGFLEAVSTGNILLLTGTFTAKIIADCARCSGPIEVPVEFEVDEQFPVVGVPASYGMNDYARVDEEEEPYKLFVENSLDVQALLRQDLIVSAPMQPLCQYGWDGDCPQAANSGLKPSAAEGRPEFSKLQSLLKGDEEEGSTK